LHGDEMLSDNRSREVKVRDKHTSYGLCLTNRQ
jgi:hypothetical protein